MLIIIDWTDIMTDTENRTKNKTKQNKLNYFISITMANKRVHIILIVITIITSFQASRQTVWF